jgi:hypothetical protein
MVGRQLGTLLGGVVQALRNIKRPVEGKMIKEYDLVFGKAVGGLGLVTMGVKPILCGRISSCLARRWVAYL